MAQYAVPPQFADFVSSKDQLLRELESGSGGLMPSDVVLYTLYPDSPLPAEQAVLLFERVQQALARIGSGYLWHRDTFNLRVVVPPTDLLVEEADCGSVHAQSDWPHVHFHGYMDVGDCVEDEWFLVHMLQALSCEMRGLSVKVWDSDGHFLLVEAADALPHWLVPENAENRLWLRGGSIYLIPPEEGGRGAHCGLKLPAALALLRGTGGSRFLCPGVQACINRRTLDVYPGLADALKHTMAVLLPRTLALLFQSHQHLLPAVVSVLCSGDRAAKRHMSSMSRLGSLLRAEDMVIVELPMTKTSYAKISFQQLHPPRKFLPLRSSLLSHEGPHSLLAAAGIDSANSGAVQRSAAKAFDLGCKLTCALEAAYHLSKADAMRAAQEAGEEEASCALAARRLGSLGGEAGAALERLYSALLLAAAASTPARGSSPPLPRSQCLRSVSDLVDWSLTEEARAAAAIGVPGLAPRLLAEGRAGQSDDWMYLSPEDFDREINRVMGGSPQEGAHASAGSSSSAGGGGASSSGGSLEEEELRRLESVIESLSGFLSAESGLGGAAPRGRQQQQGDLSEYFSDDDDDNDDDDSNDSGGGGGGGGGGQEEALPREHFVGRKQATLPHSTPAQRSTLQPRDSDDEEEEEEEEEGDDFMEEYHETMDAQLSGSTMGESFERLPGGAGVDEETNLVKSLLESRAGESGGSGPASLLLAQLGVQLPSALQR